jgi:hypothetical protein
MKRGVEDANAIRKRPPGRKNANSVDRPSRRPKQRPGTL